MRHPLHRRSLSIGLSRFRGGICGHFLRTRRDPGNLLCSGFGISKEVFIAGLAPGLISTALIAVNNLRDIPTDIKARKKTLAVRFGYRFARIEYTLCILGGLFIPLFLVLMLENHWFSLIASFAVIPLFPNKGCHFRDFR